MNRVPAQKEMGGSKTLSCGSYFQNVKNYILLSFETGNLFRAKVYQEVKPRLSTIVGINVETLLG